MLILLHELSHLKRLVYRTAMHYFQQTSDDKGNEAGKHFELSVFGFLLGDQLLNLDEEMAEYLYKVENWTEEGLEKLEDMLQKKTTLKKDDQALKNKELSTRKKNTNYQDFKASMTRNFLKSFENKY
jgi:hypothetical protein